ncbi:MAG: 3,4-dioxygenase subunit beta [Actinobacteria bacterium]|nr:3,4-dioxygenase subunit beta [Actinomycetota bacterium]
MAHDHHHGGLEADLQTMAARGLGRRSVLGLLGGGVLFAAAGCAGDTAETVASATSSGSGGASSTAAPATSGIPSIPTSGTTPVSACTAIAAETAGPFPGNGANGPNALTKSGIVRRDIRSSFGGGTMSPKGVPLTVVLRLVDTRKGCAALAGAAAYAWHCDADGRYSMYSSGVTGENFLRGVQEADAAGTVTFLTTFPGAYRGRYPHIHFEIYPSLAKATTSANKIATSQLALPEDTCNAVYATPAYRASAANFPSTPLQRDGIFADGWTTQLASVAGNVADGYTATLIVGV